VYVLGISVADVYHEFKLGGIKFVYNDPANEPGSTASPISMGCPMTTVLTLLLVLTVLTLLLVLTLLTLVLSLLVLFCIVTYMSNTIRYKLILIHLVNS
jgi:hypothetical protein